MKQSTVSLMLVFKHLFSDRGKSQGLRSQQSLFHSPNIECSTEAAATSPME